MDAQTWTYVDESEATNVVTGKWVFKIKLNADGSVSRYKARWVARGFSQQHMVDYTEVFSPVIRYSSVRTLFSLANFFDFEMYQLDVDNAFARADCPDLVFVEAPHGFQRINVATGKPFVCKLDKGLYGTKQAARLWNRKFRSHLLRTGWSQLDSDPCIYYKNDSVHGLQYCGIYVDDIILLCKTDAAYKEFAKMCKLEFPIKELGELFWFLGMRIIRDRKKRILTLDHSQQIAQYISDHDFSDLSSSITPMTTDWKFTTDDILSDSDATTRPDLSNAVHKLCRHIGANFVMPASPSAAFRYVVGNPDKCIRYVASDVSEFAIECFSDSNFGGEDYIKGKSTSGYIIYIGGGPVSWSSNLQQVIAQSSGEAELISAFDCSTVVISLRHLMEDLGHSLSGATILWEDNTAAIAISKNPVNHKKHRHLLLKYHFMQTLFDDNIVHLKYLCTSQQIADIFTKPLPRADFLKFRNYLVHDI